MKNLHLLPVCTLLFCLHACQFENPEVQDLKRQIKQLEKQLADTYKPGFGEMMASIQVHHAKLWFAGLHQNWKLADFEVREIKENLANVQKFQAEREESKLIYSMDPTIAAVSDAIGRQDLQAFKSSYEGLTNACNTCHRDVHYEFNLVKIPERPPFDNQVFSAEEEK